MSTLHTVHFRAGTSILGSVSIVGDPFDFMFDVPDDEYSSIGEFAITFVRSLSHYDLELAKAGRPVEGSKDTMNFSMNHGEIVVQITNNQNGAQMYSGGLDHFRVVDKLAEGLKILNANRAKMAETKPDIVAEDHLIDDDSIRPNVPPFVAERHPQVPK